MKIYMQKLLCNHFLNELLGNIQTQNSVEELGSKITDNEINFSFNALIKSRHDIQNLAKDTWIKYSDIILVLSLKYQVRINITFKEGNFTVEEIENFTYYYFAPPLTKNRYVFKYCPINKNLDKLISNNTLWFGEPQEFKDKFDCRYKIDVEPSEINILKFYFKKHLEENPSENEKLTLEEFSEKFHLPTKESFAKDLEEHHYKNTFSKLGVTCFSEKYNDLLMWDHYADGYKGVCLIFDLAIFKTKSDYYQFIGRKVRYFKSLPTCFFDATGKIETAQIIYSKLKDYKYENEIRELLNFQFEDSKRSIEFNPKALKGIIFGANCLESKKNELKDKLSCSNLNDVQFIESSINLIKQSIDLEGHRYNLDEMLVG